MPRSLSVFAAGGAVTVFTNHDREFVYKVPLVTEFDVAGRASHAWRQKIRREFSRSLRNPRRLSSFIDLAARRRWAQTFYSIRKQEFATCLACLSFLSEILGSEEQPFFPKTKTVSGANYIFQIGDALYLFDGPIIKQKMVECLSTDDKFSGDELQKIGRRIVDIQTELWRYGIGLTKSSETWGPSNWGRTADGCIYLVDLGSLSHDQANVRRYLTTESAKKRAEKLRNYGVSDDVDSYMSFISERLNPETLDREWESKASFREWLVADQRASLSAHVRRV